jgi:hypothetical protein
MEPSGRNRWQPGANGAAAKWLRQANSVAVGCDRLPIGAHGKEGVDGSSPSEGFGYLPACRHNRDRIRSRQTLIDDAARRGATRGVIYNARRSRCIGAGRSPGGRGQPLLCRCRAVARSGFSYHPRRVSRLSALAVPVVEVIGPPKHVVRPVCPDADLIAVRVLGDAHVVLR